jgi:hypothetical protein
MDDLALEAAPISLEELTLDTTDTLQKQVSHNRTQNLDRHILLQDTNILAEK